MRWDMPFVATAWNSALACIAVSGPGCSKKPSPGEAGQAPARPGAVCDETLRRADEALRVVEPPERMVLASEAVAQSCPGLPESARSAFHLVASVMDEERPLVIARMVADHPGVWEKACTGGAGAFAALAAAAPAEKAAILVDRCGLASGNELGTEAELRAADGMSLALALLLHRFLIDGGVEPALARALGRAAVGL